MTTQALTQDSCGEACLQGAVLLGSGAVPLGTAAVDGGLSSVCRAWVEVSNDDMEQAKGVRDHKVFRVVTG